MKLLVVGSGGREHAIAKKLLASDQVEQVFVAPGNDGMTLDGIELVNIGISEHSALINFERKMILHGLLLVQMMLWQQVSLMILNRLVKGIWSESSR